MWPKTPHPDILPPDITRLPGRPKGARQKSTEEQAERSRKKAKEARIARRIVEIREVEGGGQKMSRKGLMSEYACGLCGEKGHNKRRCPQGIQLAHPKELSVRKKRNRDDEEQRKCMLCHQPGHNRSTCSSAVANMFQDVAGSDVAASSSAPPKKKAAPPNKKKS